MWKVYDLKCTGCGILEEDEVLQPNEEPSPCPECGSKRNVLPFGASTKDLTFALFRPVDLGMGKVLETKAEFDAYIADLKEKNPDAQGIDIRGWDKAEAKRNAEERRHRQWLSRKARGICDADMRDQAKMPNGMVFR